MTEPVLPPGNTGEVASNKPQANGWRTFGIVMISVLVTVAIGYWVVSVYLFPSAFKPVTLNQKEQQVLDQKLERVGVSPSGKRRLEAQPYSEAGASRDIYFTEKELNAMLANNTELAQQLAIDLSDDLASALLLIDLDPQFPVLGGQTVKVTAGMKLGLDNGKPYARLQGVSIWGVPLPNAWLGNLKHKDLISEFGSAGGFWQAIHDGVEVIEVKEGKLHIRLKP